MIEEKIRFLMRCANSSNQNADVASGLTEATRAASQPGIGALVMSEGEQQGASGRLYYSVLVISVHIHDDTELKHLI
jgi:hypothetical protein